jgi:16S rRNA U516 pseudouridylate synthase RsuA-like enzyme
VRHLKRVRIMHIELNDLKSGSWRALTESELKTLLAAL